MNRYFRLIAIFCFVLVQLPYVLASNTIRSVEEILERLPGSPPTQDSIWSCPKYDRGCGLRIRRLASGDISTIGIRFFPAKARLGNDPIICDCIERLLLQMSLEEVSPNAGIKSWMQQHDIYATLNGMPYGSRNFLNLDRAFRTLKDASQVSIEEQFKKYVFTVTDTKEISFSLSFPKDRALIFGTDKNEEDQYIALQLSNTIGKALPEVHLLQSTRLTPTDTVDVVQCLGEAYMIDRMRATTYYYKDSKDSMQIIAGPEHPDLALTNILLLAAGSPDIKVKLTHKVYGTTPIISTPRWGDLMTVLLAKGSQIYAAARVKSDDPERLTGVLVMHNPLYDYIDMLVVTAKISELFDATSPSFEARLYTNVPQGNILDLFS